MGAGHGTNLNIPLLAGCGHQAYLDAFELLVAPALRVFRPDLIVVASGYDASCVDPLARMMATSETFRAMARHVFGLADELCGGKVVVAHEGGYSDIYLPFCGLAVVEELLGTRSPVVDPLLEIFDLQQPPADLIAFQRARLQEQAWRIFG